MTTLGSTAKVRWDRPKDRLNPERTGKQLVRIVVVVEEIGKLWLDALEGGVYPERKDNVGRAAGFGETDPTSRAALSPTQRQLRGKVKYASALIEQAMERLEEAASCLTDGFLLTDDEVLARHLEKRQAATQAH